MANGDHADLFNNKAFQVVQNDLSTKNAVGTRTLLMKATVAPAEPVPTSAESQGTPQIAPGDLGHARRYPA